MRGFLWFPIWFCDRFVRKMTLVIILIVLMSVYIKYIKSSFDLFGRDDVVVLVGLCSCV